MTVAALLSLFDDTIYDFIQTQLDTLDFHEDGHLHLHHEKVLKCGISALKIEFELHNHAHTHTHNHEHSHEHSHDHTHRGFHDICNMINGSSISDQAKKYAIETFELLGKAEAKVHGTDIDSIHFHEVGAVDSIADIVSVAILIDKINADEIIFSRLIEGSGFVNCAHGKMSVPVPAVTQILCDHSIPFEITDVDGEMITPTGAAITAYYRSGSNLSKMDGNTKIGVGAGTKDFPNANILRAFLNDNAKHKYDDKILIIETNIDDTTPEILAYTMEKLFNIDALDVWYTPIYMKKSRPAVMLSVIVKAADRDRAVEVIFNQTSSIGVRIYECERIKMQRENIEIDTKYGVIQGKKSIYGEIIKIKPEFESAKQLADSINIPLQNILFEREQ